ncbi:MAG TPA: hypothetical protein VF504_07100, partial [Solirubrobacterales bacterium]
MGAAERVAARPRLVGSFDPAAGRLELGAGVPTSSEGFVCLLDGHLDNFEALRRELDADGTKMPLYGGESSRRPGGGGVEEVLAAGFRRWGAGLPERMRGDFALLVWDPVRGEGLLARDQLGVRPLFLAEAGGRVHFAAELRDLLDLLPATPAPDPDG